MESHYAHIENDIVTSVEVVTDEFVKANPERYKGTWLKVGNGSTRDYCGKGFIYLPDKDKIITPQPFKSWKLDPITDEWTAPVIKPAENYFWDETTLSWKLLPILPV